MLVRDSSGSITDVTGLEDVPQDPDALADWLRVPSYLYALKCYLSPNGVLELSRDYSRGLQFGQSEEMW